MSNDDSQIIKTPDDLAESFLRRRSELRLRQADIGKIAKLGRFKIASIEKSAPGRSVENLIAVADALQMDIVLVKRPIQHVSIPEDD